uniref:Uncharacterized protein n=1 Tax=Opuntia streptacantha TaxID=393608 RepID=A0A7C8YBV2_OPUST
MTIQDFLKTLKTAKRPFPSPSGPASTPFSSSFSNGARETLFTTLNKSAPAENPTLSSFLSSLSSHKLHSFLSDPNVRTSDCFLAFNFLLRNQSELSFKPDLHAHLTLVCRLIKSRQFSDAEGLLNNVAFHRNYRFADILSCRVHVILSHWKLRNKRLHHEWPTFTYFCASKERACETVLHRYAFCLACCIH